MFLFIENITSCHSRACLESQVRCQYIITCTLHTITRTSNLSLSMLQMLCISESWDWWCTHFRSYFLYPELWVDAHQASFICSWKYFESVILQPIHFDTFNTFFKSCFLTSFILEEEATLWLCRCSRCKALLCIFKCYCYCFGFIKTFKTSQLLQLLYKIY